MKKQNRSQKERFCFLLRFALPEPWEKRIDFKSGSRYNENGLTDCLKHRGLQHLWLTALRKTGRERKPYAL